MLVVLILVINNVCVYQLITLYILNIQNCICQLFHNKVGEEGNAASDLFPDTGLRVNFFFEV